VARGKPNGTVPYGYRRRYVTDDAGKVVDSTDTPHEPEAAIVREITARLLAGDTVRGIADDLNTRGVPTPGRAAAWRPSTVRKLAMRATSAGLRTHRGVVVGEAAWEPLVARDDYDKVVALLSSPGRAPARHRDGTRRHLLSFGVGRCGVCGSHLRVTARGGNALYVCDSPAGCVGRRQEWVDQVAEATMTHTLQRRDVRQVLARGDRAAARAQLEVDQLRGRLSDATLAYTAGTLPLTVLEQVTATLAPQIEAAETAARKATTALPPLVRGLLGKTDVQARWDALSVAEKHMVMQALGLVVTVMPAPKGPGFKAEFVVPSWSTS